MTAFTKLLVAPATEDLCSFVSRDSFLTYFEEPPGVETSTTLRGVDGAKKGELVCLSVLLFGAILRMMIGRQDGAEREIGYITSYYAEGSRWWRGKRLFLIAIKNNIEGIYLVT